MRPYVICGVLFIASMSVLLLHRGRRQCRRINVPNRQLLFRLSSKARQCTALVLLLSLQAVAAPSSEWHFSGVDRVVAVSDIHGAYDAMLATLANAGVIDKGLAWSGGATHLVVTGDLLDRGPDSRQVMDLLMRLEGESVAAGGRVHALIGNHEVMNLVGDVRYVASAEYAAFAEQESADERERWFQHYRREQQPEANGTRLRERFNKLAPAGFFGHRRAFRADGHYGKWLLEKPLMVVIDGTAFVHGGMSPYVAEHGLAGVNGTLKAELLRYVTQLGVLEDHDILSPTDAFYDHALLLKAKSEAGKLGDPVMAAAKAVMELNDSAIHGSNSPLWYRGTVGCGELTGGDALNAALTRIAATRVVIGHTPTVTRRVLQRMHGRVIEIDTGMLAASYKGSGNALIIEGDSLTVVNENGTTISQPVEHPRRVGDRSQSISADDLIRILSSGTLSNSKVDASGRTLVQVSVDGINLSAYFDEKPRKKGFLPELAAYQLDRLLDLDMVPVTVRREVNGKQGTLQFSPTATKTEPERVHSGRGGSAWCPLARQWNTMYIFDALIFNSGRRPEFMLYSPKNWQMLLVGHAGSFGTGKGRPPHLKNIEMDINDSWVSALGELSDDVLHEKLADVLDKRQLASLGKRRDRLIKDASR